MKNGEEIRKIQIPDWMDKIISERAVDHQQSFDREIVSLVEAAIQNSTQREKRHMAEDLQQVRGA
jgi:hypothetical protein